MLRHHRKAQPIDKVIRVWRHDSEENKGYWHVSYGSEAPLQQLRAFVGVERDSCGGMCWDEALEAVTVLMIAPGACGPGLRYLEPPAGIGWRLEVEISPAGTGEWRVAAPDRVTDQLQLGEALATFVHLTYPRQWGGFGAHRESSFALVKAAS